MSAIEITDGALAFGHRKLWSGFDLTVEPGEFVAVLGPNGSGKTSLLRVLLGQLALTDGQAKICGTLVREGHRSVGYIPQQEGFERQVALRGRDLVGLGVDGHRWGLGVIRRRARNAAIDDALGQVGGQRLGAQPLGSMSGGEQQRMRVAQALASNPSVLLCDEPLLSLDLANQQLVTRLIDRRRRNFSTAVMFVTHEINPVLPFVDRVIYIVDGKYRIGTVDEVMTSQTLSQLYRTDVDVLKVRGRLIVVGTGDSVDALGPVEGHHHGHGHAAGSA